jgi:hypothetical protein
MLIQMFASPRTIGRWIMQNLPLNRLGNRHASLSSGGSKPPKRANVLKFLVIASDTIGPPALKDV